MSDLNPEDLLPGADELGLYGWALTTLDRRDSLWLLREVQWDDLTNGGARALHRAVEGLLAADTTPDLFSAGEWLKEKGWEHGDAFRLVNRATGMTVGRSYVATGIVQSIRRRSAEKRLAQLLFDGQQWLADGLGAETVRERLVAAMLHGAKTSHGAVWLDNALDAEAERIEKNERIVSLKSGLPKLDRLTGGLECGQVGVIAAFPACGKTSLMMQEAAHAAETLGPVAVVSLESSEAQLARRRLAGMFGVPYQDLRDLTSFGHGWSADEREEWAAIIRNRRRSKHGILVDTCSSEIGRLVAAVHGYALEHGIKALFLDYGQLLSDDRKRGASKGEEMGSIARALKTQIATPLNLPVRVLLQVDKSARKRGGALGGADLAWSQEWENVARQIWTISEDPEYPSGDELSGMLLSVVKNTNDKSAFVHPLVFCKPAFEFREREEYRDEAEAPPERRWS